MKGTVVKGMVSVDLFWKVRPEARIKRLIFYLGDASPQLRGYKKEKKVDMKLIKVGAM